MTAEQMNRAQNYANWNSFRTFGPKYIKVKVIIASTPGPGGDAATTADVQAALDIANVDFLPGNIQFILCDAPLIVDDMDLYAAQNTVFAPVHDQPGYINLLVAGYSLTAAGWSLYDKVMVCGYALPTHVLSHELGHCLGLYHTHDTPYGAELVNGSNCSTAGDLICDTPADPGLHLPGNLNIYTCAYTGTGVDVNGQPYTPLTNNIMSYAIWDCYNAFTAGQFNVMNYVLDSMKNYLHRTYAPILIDSFPLHFCVYDTPVTLSANVAGVFSGVHVNGNTLGGFQDSSGGYTVHFTPAVLPDSANNHVDQYFCDPQYSGFPLYTTSGGYVDTLTSLWQSFTAHETGIVNSIEVLMRPLAPSAVQYIFRKGSGTTGPVIYSSALNIPTMPAMSWISFDIPPNTNVFADSVYTLQVIASTDSIECAISCGNSWGIAGTFYYNGLSSIVNYDFNFKEWVTAVPECQDAYRFYDIRTPYYSELTNVASYYCVSDDSVILEQDQIWNAVRFIQIDGQRDSLLIPANLSVGAHTVEYITSTYGCYDTLQYNITVVDGSASFANLIDPVCTSTPGYLVVASPVGGQVSIDATSNSFFDASALGAGWHFVEYNNYSRDTITWPDQECCFTNTTFRFFEPITDSIYWQSFAPEQSGILETVMLRYFGYDTLDYETRLYKGEGISGLLLLTDTVNLPTMAFLDEYVALFDNSPSLSVTEDSLYTFSFKKLPSTSIYQYGAVHVPGYGYARGVSGFDSTGIFEDFVFRQIITQYTGCASYTSDSVYVDLCLGTEPKNNNTAPVAFPNPASDLITVTTVMSGTVLSIYAANGAIVSTFHLSGGQSTVDISSLSEGIYFLELADEKHTTTQRLSIVR